MGSRRKGRILAFQSMYAWDLSRTPLPKLLEFLWLDADKRERLQGETIAFARLLLTGTHQNVRAIDDAIKEQVEHWDFSRIAKVDLAVLRISVFALLFQPDIPYTVTIDEAVSIAREYGGDESYRFVNGVLDGIRKKLHESRV